VISSTLIEKCCLIAQPVAGNPTHFMVEQAFAEAGLDWRFMSFEVAPEKLGDAMRGIRALGLRGVKVAEPHQEAVQEYLDELSELARACGSVNCVTADDDGRMLGDNTEGVALVGLIREQIDFTGAQATILGTGRLARALAVALGNAGVAAITCVGRSQEAGERLAELIRTNTPATASIQTFGEKETIKIDAGTSLFVNATSLGTADPAAPLPLDVTAADARHGIVVDVTYNSAGTWLTRQAAQRGYRVIDGVDLYVRQTALALKNWTGEMPDAATLREAAEEFLGL
jgi:shikimate dehydrogenase